MTESLENARAALRAAAIAYADVDCQRTADELEKAAIEFASWFAKLCDHDRYEPCCVQFEDPTEGRTL